MEVDMVVDIVPVVAVVMVLLILLLSPQRLVQAPTVVTVVVALVVDMAVDTAVVVMMIQPKLQQLRLQPVPLLMVVAVEAVEAAIVVDTVHMEAEVHKAWLVLLLLQPLLVAHLMEAVVTVQAVMLVVAMAVDTTIQLK